MARLRRRQWGCLRHERVFLATPSPLKAYTSPVAYLSDAGVEAELNRVAAGIEIEVEFLRSVPREGIRSHAFHAVRYAAICIRNPGFVEEREWRVIYCPSLEKSEHIKQGVHSIGGVPQLICKLRLADMPEFGFSGASIPLLVERIIIGPTKYPASMHEAFVELLRAAGCQDAEKRVVVSTIPLRR